ncbi:MAG: trehalose-phosphatase [Nitrospirae bacterium GWF2_44_13]|nr:MAG: trehalose-phosphatase [Nitrospirae bacterium GWF2_44_13]OGW66326.1 MAG: trehalose-phosphatase [Nitrospirae bacterium RIFOXYA2_FULL_44_9]OGW72959.1 MAG: trehalose-phosphatase [Nitrospirae bacterium RIFOXYC2_FULL_44_7]
MNPRYILKENVFKKISKGQKIALFLDFDGTLVPIRKEPSRCVLAEKMKEQLESLTGSESCYLSILSGRSLSDIRGMVCIRDICYSGNHGLIISGNNMTYIHPKALIAKPFIDRAVRMLNKEIAGIEGAWIEGKKLTASLHFRSVRKNDVPLVKKAFYNVVSEFSGDRTLAVIKGKQVLELAPDASWNKGSAALWILNNLKGKYLPVYVGDDWTDETAFRALNKRGITIRVGKSAKTAANYYLKSQREISAFLKRVEEFIC